jgi:hypothetical protein
MERHGVSLTHQNTHTLVIYEHEQNQIQSQTNFYRFYTHSTVPSTSPLLLCTATSHHTVPQSHRHTIPLSTFPPNTRATISLSNTSAIEPPKWQNYRGHTEAVFPYVFVKAYSADLERLFCGNAQSGVPRFIIGFGRQFG